MNPRLLRFTRTSCLILSFLTSAAGFAGQDFDGTLVASPVVSEPVPLSYSTDTVGEAVDLFDFILRDGGGGDGAPLMVSSVVVNVTGTANDTDRAKITWRLNGAGSANVTGTYNAGSDTLTFSGLSISVADGTEETYTLNGYFNDNSGLTHENSVILSIDGDTDLTVGGAGTGMGPTSSVTNGTGTVITDNIGPVVSEGTPVVPVDNDNTPDVTINISENGTLSVGGSCGSVDEGPINSGSRTITLSQADNTTPLLGGSYSDCTVNVTDEADNASNVLLLSPFVVDVQAPGVDTKSTLNLEVGDTDVPISAGNLLASDNFSGPSGITFTVTSPPVHGTLSAGKAFTQADINAGLVTYDHDGSANFSDSFVFKVEDEAGNVNSNTTFNINIAPARIKPIAFLFNFSADAPSEAQANGCVRLRGAAIEVPFAFEGLLPVPSAEILDLSVVVTGASAGNGTFGLDDFDAIAWDSNGGELNFDLDLVGQSTDGDPWGTVVEESAGDFNLFGLNPDAPTGVFYFTLAADNGNADSMELTSMIRSDSEYCDALFSSSFEPNIAPTVPVTVVVDIARPDTTQDLTCLASGSTDPDSPFVVYEYQWYIDNIPADNRMTLDSSFTQRGQVARCEARANDLEGGISQWISSISVEIFNSPPAAPQVNLLPESPDSLTDLDCIISTSSTDADGDFLTYDYQWFGDDSLIGASTNTLDAILTAPGMTVRCEARAFDGFDSGEWARSPDRVIMPQ